MNTAAGEWVARVAARNEIETAKARQTERRLALSAQLTFDWTGNGAAIRLLPLSAEGAGQEAT